MIRNMKFSGAIAKEFCREAQCPNVSRSGCRVLRTNVWPYFVKQLKDARKERKG